MQKKLGIIAGSGTLPASVVQACQRAKRPFCVIGLKGFVQPELLPADIAFYPCRLGGVGRVVQILKQEHVKEIVFIGGVRRPGIWELFPDWTAIKMLSRIALKKGDDSLLRSVVKQAENLGFSVVGVHTILPELLAPVGVLGSVRPTHADQQDIARGVQVAQVLGKADVGQAVVVQQGLVLAVEGIEGTACLIARSKDLKRRGKAPVLVKMCKPGQDKRVDLPTIGPKTVQGAYDSGIKGIAVQAGATLMTDVQEIIRLADKLKIFVVGIK